MLSGDGTIHTVPYRTPREIANVCFCSDLKRISFSRRHFSRVSRERQKDRLRREQNNVRKYDGARCRYLSVSSVFVPNSVEAGIEKSLLSFFPLRRDEDEAATRTKRFSPWPIFPIDCFFLSGKPVTRKNHIFVSVAAARFGRVCRPVAGRSSEPGVALSLLPLTRILQ